MMYTLCSDTFLGQANDCDKLTSISPFNVNISENCEMSETNGRNLLEGKGKVAAGPSHVGVSACAPPAGSAADSVLEDSHLPGGWRWCAQRSHRSARQRWLWDGASGSWCGVFSFPKRYLSSLLCAVLTLAQVDSLGWFSLKGVCFTLHKWGCIAERKIRAFKVLQNLDEQMISICCPPSAPLLGVTVMILVTDEWGCRIQVVC